MRLFNLKNLSLFSLAVAAISSTASAQDSHYWSNQYGTRSALLGGAVVGSVRDTSAGFYNPGALGFIDNEALSVSANALKYESVSLDNGAGTGDDLDSDNIQALPLMISGIWKDKDLPDHTFGYTFLTKDSSKLNFSARRDSQGEIFPGGGPEDYIGQFTYDQQINEYWGGLSYAYKATPNVSVGLTNFLAYRSENRNSSALVRTVNPQFPDAFVVADNTSLVDYDSLRLLWKLGAAAEFDALKLGISVTTPSVNIYGDGTSARDITGAGTGNTNFIADDRQENLDAETRTPFSVAGGATYDLEKTKLHATVEWFGAKGAYNVMVPESRNIVKPSNAEAVDARDALLVTSGADAVVNWALGVEHQICDKVTGFASFRSDYEAQREGTNLGISNWDIYHATVGATYRRENSELGVGLVYSFGDTDDYSQAVNFDDASLDNGLFGRSQQTSVDYEAVSLIVGYTYFLN